MGTYERLSRFILSRGLWLCLLLQMGCLALLGRAEQGGAMAIQFYDWAETFLLAALTAFGCALIGGLLAEDMLRYYGE